MKNKSFTLIEIIVVLAIVSFMILTFTAMSIFFIRQVSISRERVNMWSQLEYTLNDMRTRCVSAITTTTPILTSGGNITIDSSTTNTFSFQGESDIYNITPDDLSDNVVYTYKIQSDGDSATSDPLVLEIAGGDTNVLIDGKYNPILKFEHIILDEPNFITVTLSLKSDIFDINASRTDGIRFWFMDVVQ